MSKRILMFILLSVSLMGTMSVYADYLSSFKNSPKNKNKQTITIPPPQQALTPDQYKAGVRTLNQQNMATLTQQTTQNLNLAKPLPPPPTSANSNMKQPSPPGQPQQNNQPSQAPAPSQSQAAPNNMTTDNASNPPPQAPIVPVRPSTSAPNTPPPPPGSRDVYTGFQNPNNSNTQGSQSGGGWNIKY